MQVATKAAVSAILAADTSIDKKAIEEAFKILEGKQREKVGRVVHAKEVAALLGITTKTVRDYAVRGLLVGVYVPDNPRRIGYTEESVRKVLAGSAAASGKEA